jgi:hypothetical protein
MLGVISFDCGIKNLSYCIEVNNCITNWCVVNLLDEVEHKCLKCDKKSTYHNKELYYCGRHRCEKSKKIKPKNIKNYSVLDINMLLLECLRNIDLKGVDICVIENQPQKNAKMKTLQYLIFSFFCMIWENDIHNNNKKVLFYSAKNKLKNQITSHIACPYKDPYKRRKYYSVKIVEELVKNTEYEEMYKQSKKKDDLADARLQLESFKETKMYKL